MQFTPKENIGWIDVLRIAACFAVVFAHSCDAFVAQFEMDREAFLAGVFGGSLVRPSVPLFVMMTGALLLPLNENVRQGTFYRKRIGRLALPLVFWSVLLPLISYIYLVYINPGTTNPQFPMENYTLGLLVRNIYSFIFNFNFDTTPLWYLYMLAGLYIIMPILSSWIKDANRKEIKTVLYIWAASMCIPYIKMFAPMLGYQGNYGNMGLYGECDWNVYGTFYYVSGFIGYLILAFYLKKYPLEWSWKKTAYIGTPMFILGYMMTSIGYIITNEYYPGNYAYLEIIWYFCSINVFMMTLPIFITIQKLNCESRPALSRLASLTFGIYLCHFPITFISYDLYAATSLPYLARIIISAITTFTISAAIVWIMSKSKITRKLIK